jgi:hypothetical protein
VEEEESILRTPSGNISLSWWLLLLNGQVAPHTAFSLVAFAVSAAGKYSS